MNVAEKLDRLAGLRAAPDAIRLKKQALIDTILTAEIQSKLAEIDADFAYPLLAAQQAAADLEEEIKAEVIATGATIKGAHLMAVYAKGRVSWSSQKLEGMMSLIPQLKDARKEGYPTVSFRAT